MSSFRFTSATPTATPSWLLAPSDSEATSIQGFIDMRPCAESPS